MKKVLATLALVVACATSYSQTSTNLPPPFTNAPPAATQLFGFLSQSNLLMATYAMYDTTSKKPGAGIGLGYKLDPYIVAVLRFDAVVNPKDGKLAVYVPSGNLQLQLPLPAFGPVKVTPFTFGGIATTLNGGDGGEPIGIFGVGAAVGFTRSASTSKLVPAGLIGDWERWSGAGFNNSQIRAGLYWQF